MLNVSEIGLQDDIQMRCSPKEEEAALCSTLAHYDERALSSTLVSLIRPKKGINDRTCLLVRWPQMLHGADMGDP